MTIYKVSNKPPKCLEQKLQRHLDHPGAHIRLDVAESSSRGADVADRQPEIGMVQYIEQLAAELNLFRLRQANVLECREVPVHVSRALDRVTAFVPELLDRRIRVLGNALKSIYVEPLCGGMRPGIRIPNHIGPIAGKSRNLRRLPLQRNVVGIEYRERSAAHGGYNSVQLPVAQNVPIPATRMLQKRKAPLITQHEAMAGIEHGPAAFRSEIKRLRAKFISSRHWLRCRARDVERGNVVDGVRPGIGSEERKSVTETLSQAGFQSVIAGIRDAGDLAD